MYIYIHVLDWFQVASEIYLAPSFFAQFCRVIEPSTRLADDKISVNESFPYTQRRLRKAAGQQQDSLNGNISKTQPMTTVLDF